MNERKIKRFAVKGVLGVGLLVLVLVTVYLMSVMNKVSNIEGNLSGDTLDSMKTR